MDKRRGTVLCGQAAKSQEAKFCAAGPLDSEGWADFSSLGASSQRFQPQVLVLSMTPASQNPY